MIPPETPSLDLNKIHRPDSFYWPGYTWVWNDRLNKDQVIAQVQDMANHGALTPMVISEPKSFRPRTMPTRLEPDYLSQEYLQIYRTMVQSAAAQQMNVWLYDEGGWPSGSVCGEIVKSHPELAKQRLIRRRVISWQGRTIKIPSDCVFAGLYQKITSKSCSSRFIRALQSGQTEKIEITHSIVWFFYAKKEGTYPDLLNPKSTQEFLRLTHEAYKTHLAEYFGSVIPVVFTDEPKISSKPPWTEGLLEDFRKSKGYDLGPKLPSLFGGLTVEDMQTRIDFYDWWSERFATAFFGQIQQWCHMNHLLSGGHLNGEDETMGALYHGYGHVLRPFRKMDIPGVDSIWRQVWPGQINHHFPKFASSVANQAGTRWALSESFAVYGSGLTPAQMKWVVNYQLVRGINLFDIFGYQYSNQDWFIGGERPVLGEINPLWNAMDDFHSYTARLCYILSCGKPKINVAVYYPVRDIWANSPDTKQTIHLHDALIQALHNLHIDYDFVDDDILTDLQTININKTMQIGAMTYHTILISNCSWISPTAKQKLMEFRKNGGKLIWINPDSSNSNKTTVVPDGFSVTTLNEFSSLLQSPVQFEPPSPLIRMFIRSLSNGTIYFFTNETETAQNCVVTFLESASPIQIDPEAGSFSSIPFIRSTSSCCKVALNFPFAGSKVLFFPHNPTPAIDSKISNLGKPMLNLTTGWQARKIKSYSIRKHSITIISEELDTVKPISLGDWRPWANDSFSGTIDYSIAFSCSSEMAKKGNFLNCGNVSYICDVELNGESLGKRIWPPYQFSVHGKLREGVNSLKISVTNTLANQYLHTNFRKLWNSNQLGPYHPKALKFERDSLPSGLFGPVEFLE